MNIQLTDAARFYSQQDHQSYAWHWLQDQLSADQIQKFAELYRAAEPAKKHNGVITPDVMHAITGYRASSFDSHFCDDFNALLQESGFAEHPEERNMLIANLLHETGGMIYFKELAYGDAYEWRSDLGNHGGGDGHRYRGSGCLMLTGRANYQKLADDLHDKRVMDGCDYVADKYPFRSALTWLKDNKLLEICKEKGFDSCCYRINGGWNGIADRRRWYAIVNKVLPVQ